ncbi:MAG: hypothetical protein WC764_04345 [Candidatus Paceibacterota bacterium]|jgi:hypothetical protein
MKLNESASIKGEYRLTLTLPETAKQEYQAILSFLKTHPVSRLKDEIERASHASIYRGLLADYYKRAKVEEMVFSNLIPTVGRSVLAQRLANTTTYTGIVNYAALGSGTTAPNNSDTQLGTESYRKTIDSQTYTNNVAYLSVFIPAGTATATHYEAGLFIDGAAGANTGQIFSRVLFSPPVAKTALVSLTLDISLTIS